MFIILLLLKKIEACVEQSNNTSNNDLGSEVWKLLI